MELRPNEVGAVEAAFQAILTTPSPSTAPVTGTVNCAHSARSATFGGSMPTRPAISLLQCKSGAHGI